MAEEPRGRRLKVQQQVDNNGEVVLKTPTKKAFDKTKVPSPLNPELSVKKGVIHKILAKLIKKTGFNPTITDGNVTSRSDTDDTTQTVSLMDFNEESLLALLSDINMYGINNETSAAAADNIGWHVYKNNEGSFMERNNLANPNRRNFKTEFHHRKKSDINLHKVRITLLLIQLKKEILKENGINIGNKAYKEKKYNVITQGPM